MHAARPGRNSVWMTHGVASTSSDFLVDRLAHWGVSRVYGYPGDGINGILGALNRASDRITFVQGRHEEMAAFMACPHAKFTGEGGGSWPPPGRGPFICSMVSTMPNWTISLSSRS